MLPLKSILSLSIYFILNIKYKYNIKSNIGSISEGPGKRPHIHGDVELNVYNQTIVKIMAISLKCFFALLMLSSQHWKLCSQPLTELPPVSSDILIAIFNVRFRNAWWLMGLQLIIVKCPNDKEFNLWSGQKNVCVSLKLFFFFCSWYSVFVHCLLISKNMLFETNMDGLSIKVVKNRFF